MFRKITERNSWEGETFHYYFDNGLFVKELAFIEQGIASGLIDKSYSIDKKLYDIDFVEDLPSGGSYMAHHNLVIGFLEPISKWDDPLYKARGLRRGDMKDLIIAKRWAMRFPSEPLPLFLEPRPGWAVSVKGANAYVVLGQNDLGFADHYHGDFQVGRKFLMPKTGDVVRTTAIHLCDRNTILEYVKEYPRSLGSTYSTKEGSEWRPCDNISYFEYEVIDTIPQISF